MGRRLAGPLIEERGARVELLTDQAVADATASGADFVISTAVAFHIHPDDVGVYLATLARLAQRPGARLVFDAKLSGRPVRYAAPGWAWPLDFYREHLAPLEYVASHGEAPCRRVTNVAAALLEFRGPG